MTTQHPSAWAREGELFISFFTAGPIPDPVWEAYCEALGDLRVEKVLATSVGSVEVSPVQRKRIADVLQRRVLTIAVVTDELVVRGLVTAISWFGIRQLRSFSWERLDEALGYLGAAAEPARVVELVERLRADVERDR